MFFLFLSFLIISIVVFLIVNFIFFLFFLVLLLLVFLLFSIEGESSWPILFWMFGFIMDLHRFNWWLHGQAFLTFNVNIFFTLFRCDSFGFSTLSTSTSTSFHFCCMMFTLNLFCCMFCWFSFSTHWLQFIISINVKNI